MAAIEALRSHSTPYVRLARERVIDPLTVIQSAFDIVDVQRSWEESAIKLFSVAGDEDRLNIGPMLVDEGNTVFGISRRRPV
jgi:hypothetical protein